MSQAISLFMIASHSIFVFRQLIRFRWLLLLLLILHCSGNIGWNGLFRVGYSRGRRHLRFLQSLHRHLSLQWLVLGHLIIFLKFFILIIVGIALLVQHVLHDWLGDACSVTWLFLLS